MKKTVWALFLVFALTLSLCVFSSCDDDENLYEGDPAGSSEAENAVESQGTTSQSNGENENGNKGSEDNSDRGNNGNGDNGNGNIVDDDEKNWAGPY